jgi:hypothetical protein
MNSQYQCKTMPGFEKYQSKAEQQDQAKEELGFFNHNEFNPSEQEVSLADRTASKMTQEELVEHGLAPTNSPQEMFLMLSSPKRKRK